MNIQKIENRILYVPNANNGLSTFNGKAQFSQRVLDVIGEEGVNHISNKLKQCLGMRKELFGNGTKEYYGLYSHQRFFDLKERISFDVKSIINQHNINDYNEEFIGEFYKEDFQDDFIIEVNEAKDDWLNMMCSTKRKKSNIRAYRSIKAGILSRNDI